MATYATVPSQQYILVIPPALDKPGLIDIPANDILSLTSVATPSCNGGGGGGGGGSGTLNIVSSDDTTLSVVLSGTGPALSTGSTGQTSSTDVSTFDGTYSVYRCDAPATSARANGWRRECPGHRLVDGPGDALE